MPTKPAKPKEDALPTKPAKPKEDAKDAQAKKPAGTKKQPCPKICRMMPISVPYDHDYAQSVLHPRKDVFVLKVSKVSTSGVRRSKMELELVTPKSRDTRPPARLDTREAQCALSCECCAPCRHCCKQT